MATTASQSNSGLPQTRPHCPLCRGKLQLSFLVHEHAIQECVNCGHQAFLVETARENHVQATYGDDYFFGGAAGYTDYLKEGDLLRKRGQSYARLLQKHIPAPGRVLDVGAAAGFILKGYQDMGWHGEGVEPNVRMAEWGRTNNNVQVNCGALEDYQTDEPFDLVSMIQVISHFVDPSVAVRQAAAQLVPRGFLLIETWDRQSLAARMFGKSWHEYSPPSVMHWFSKGGLRRLAGQHGFEFVAGGRPQRSIQAGHAASLLRYKLNGSLAGKVAGPMLGLIPQNLRLPYPGDDLFWALYQLKR